MNNLNLHQKYVPGMKFSWSLDVALRRKFEALRGSHVTTTATGAAEKSEAQDLQRERENSRDEDHG